MINEHAKKHAKKNKKAGKKSGKRLLGNRKQLGMAALLLGFLMLVTVGVFLKFNVFTVSGIPELLPEKETVFFINFDFRSQSYSPEKTGIIKLFSERFDLQLENEEMKNALSGLMGYALIRPLFREDGAETEMPVLLLELRDSLAGQTFLSTLPEDKKSEFSIVKNFLIVSENETAHKIILDAAESNSSFAMHVPFVRASQKLPGNSFASFAYEVSGKNAKFLQPFNILAGKWRVSESAASESAASKSSRSFWHLISLSSDKAVFLPQSRYRASLLPYFRSDPVLFLGGDDLASRIRFFDNDLSLLSSIFRAYGMDQKHIAKHILPLLSSEYGFSLSAENTFLAILKLEKPISVEKSILFLRQQIPSVLGIIFPHLREIRLADGSIGKEWYASKEHITVSEENPEGASVTAYRTEGQTFEFFMAQKNDLLIFTDDRAALNEALAGKIKGNLRESDIYAEKIREVMRGVNELSILKKEWLSKILDERFHDFFQAFDELVLSVRYQKDGAEMFVAL